MTELENKIKQNALNYIDKCEITKADILNCERYVIPIPYTSDGIRGYSIDRLVYSSTQKKFTSVEYYFDNGEDVELRTIEL